MTFNTAMNPATTTFGWRDISTMPTDYTEPFLEESPMANLLETTDSFLLHPQVDDAAILMNVALQNNEIAFVAEGRVSPTDADGAAAIISKLRPAASEKLDALALKVSSHAAGLPLFPTHAERLGGRDGAGQGILLHEALNGPMVKRASDRGVITPESGALFAHAMGINIYENLYALSEVQRLAKKQAAYWPSILVGIFGIQNIIQNTVNNGSIPSAVAGGLMFGLAIMSASTTYLTNASSRKVTNWLNLPTNRKKALAAIDTSASAHLTLLRGFADAFPNNVSTDAAHAMITSGLLADGLQRHLDGFYERDFVNAAALPTAYHKGG